jgi:hypothetical protein
VPCPYKFSELLEAISNLKILDIVATNKHM